MLNKKAQIGETLTWIIATLIIIGVLVLFIYSSSLLAKTKSLNIPELKMDSSEEVNWIEAKISFAHIKSNNLNKEIIDNWINKNEK